MSPGSSSTGRRLIVAPRGAGDHVGRARADRASCRRACAAGCASSRRPPRCAPSPARCARGSSGSAPRCCVQRLADAGDVAVAEDAEDAAEERLLAAVARRALLRQKPHHRLRHRQARLAMRVISPASPRAATNAVDFVERRHEVGAAVAGDDDRAAGVAHAGRALERPSLQVAVEEAARERIAGAEHVQHLDRKRRRRRPAARSRRKTVAPRAPRLSTSASMPLSSSAAAPRGDVGRARTRRRALPPCRPRASPSAAAPASAPANAAGAVPLIGAVVDVDDDRHAGSRARRRPPQRWRRAPARGSARCRSGTTTRLSAIGARADIVDRQLAIGAVVAIEGQRKAVGRLDGQDDGAGAAARLARDEPRLDLLAVEKRGDEVADLIVADRGEQRRAQAEAARADADVGRAAADVGVEAA